MLKIYSGSSPLIFMKSIVILVVLVLIIQHTYSQSVIPVPGTADSLQSVVVNAFLSNQKWRNVAASVAVLTAKDIQSISNTTLLPALNTIAGVRMEERSPGSYRLSIRGSTLRSPFGVRNVKFYWNDIPLTDAGGNTYLNLIAVSQLTGMEVIKGPSASIYGAGTGGVVLLKSSQSYLPGTVSDNQLSASVSGGSYGLFNEDAGWTHRSNNFTSSLQQSHLQSDGYRQQSAVRKDAIKWDGSWRLDKQQFHFLLFYTDLYYQTPGGLTKAQLLQDPRLARPASGSIPGAVEQKAAIYNKTAFAGLSHEYQINSSFSTEASFMLNHTAYTNPFITNYENRDETNVASRAGLLYHHFFGKTDVQWSTGGEWLYNHSRIDDYGNNKGNRDTLQLKDNLYVNQWFVFSQVQVTMGNFNFSIGGSLNNQGIHYKRLTDPSMLNYVNTNKKNIVAPRFSVLYKLDQHISLYGIAAKGFSPPTLAEVHPQDRIFHSELQPEYGWNYEAGLKGVTANDRLQFDLSAYDFELKDAIVIRINAVGAQYFVNAGSASEKGIETWVKYHILNQSSPVFKDVSVWTSISYQPYRFTSFKEGSSDYSGNAVTGVPRHVWVSGMDAETKKNWYFHLVYNNTSTIPLDDANDEYANAYHLLQFKCGKRLSKGKLSTDVFMGVDNLLNEVYSLGNDINAANRRFYNPAAGRNFNVGISFNL